MFQANNGMFYIVTENEIKTLPSDGLSGAFFEGAISSSTGYNALGYRNAVSTRRGVFGLGQYGLINLDSGEVTPLTTYKRNRKITDPVGTGLTVDLRNGKMFAYDEGIYISFGVGRPFCVINQERGYISWWDGDSVSGEIVGILRASDGTQMIAFTDRVVAIYGDDPDCEFGLACEINIAPMVSAVISEIIISATGNGSGTVRSYCRASDIETTTPFAVGSSRAGIDVWDTAIAVASEFASASHRRAVRSDGVYFEVGISKDMAIQGVQVVLSGQGTERHRG
jgi:hypothetical protein